ncbi:MAG: murein biosynthesis integral membrane protein MurJ [Clostridia bacterium]|nr:murein biosynthesis integral membrane protein MurJ [Clostridia bacterium]
MEEKSSKAIRTMSFMSFIIFCAKFLGLFRETLIGSVYGQGYLSDIINTASSIPLLFFDMTLGVAILSTFVPVFNNFMLKDGRERAEKFACNFISLVTIVAIGLSLLGIIFSKEIVGFIANGYDEIKIMETARLLKVLFPSIIFTAVAYIAVGLLQSYGEFNIPSLISLVSNSVMILYLVIFGDSLGLMGVAVSMVVAWALQLIVQIPSLYKKGFKFRPSFNLRDKGIGEALKLALPILISSWVQPICTLINTMVGSNLGDGIVSGLNWANKIYIIMVGVFAYAVTNFIFPKLSRQSAGGDTDGFAKTTRSSLSWTIFVIGFISALFIALSEPVIKVVFEHGKFTAENTRVTATALYYYSFGMVAYAICEILNKSFYAIKDGVTPMVVSILGVMVNIGVMLLNVFVFKMEIGGLALATTISSVFIALSLMIMINRKGNKVITKEFIFDLVKIIISSAVAVFIAGAIYGFIKDMFGEGMVMTLLKLCIASLPALIVYLGLGFLLKLEMLKELRRNK